MHLGPAPTRDGSKSDIMPSVDIEASPDASGIKSSTYGIVAPGNLYWSAPARLYISGENTGCKL